MAQIGLIGLATMGANLARNIANKGFSVAVFNRTTEKTDEFIAKFGGQSGDRDGGRDSGQFGDRSGGRSGGRSGDRSGGRSGGQEAGGTQPTSTANLIGTHTLEEFVTQLEKPRKIIILVKAGEAVDAVLKQLIPLLDHDDIIIDGGNSHFRDTESRQSQCSRVKINFIGMGVSGGEEGALHGPSLMPGGNETAYNQIAEILKAVAADDGTGKDTTGGKCVTYIGPAGSGHFVKMVHNGIEYGIMQCIAESYDILQKIGGMSNAELTKIFAQYNQNQNSFLLEITAKIFTIKDEKTGRDLIDVIRDTAEQKGTGKWTTEAAFELGVSIPTINASVDARIISGDSDLRKRRKNIPQKLIETGTPENLADLVRDALNLSTICTYSQGFELLKKASEEYNWNLNLSEIARIWRGGCIIRSKHLESFQDLYGDDSAGSSTAESSSAGSSSVGSSSAQEFLDYLETDTQTNWRQVAALAIGHGIPVPSISASLSYYDAMRSTKLPQNLTQAQRNFFGAHPYKRIQ